MLVSVHINRSDKAKSFHDKMINFRLTLLSSIQETIALKLNIVMAVQFLYTVSCSHPTTGEFVEHLLI